MGASGRQCPEATRSGAVLDHSPSGAGRSRWSGDQALTVGSFNGDVDLTLSFSLTAANIQGANFSYLVASGALTNPVPEPGQWALMLLGLGVLVALARRSKAGF